MNYRKIYIDLMSRARGRSKKDGVYYERHHIIPDFMFLNRKRKGPAGHVHGNPNDKLNIVLLTAREHILSHILLARIYRGTHYEYGCVGSLMIMLGERPNSKRGIERSVVTASLRKTRAYERLRIIYAKRMVGNLKGQIIVKDAETGERIGKVPVDHPNVISRKWVHHSSGRIQPKEERAKHSANRQGKGNPRHSGLDDDVYLESYMVAARKADRAIPHSLWRAYCVYHGLPTFKNCPGIRKPLFQRMLDDAAKETGKPFVREEWIRSNRKGTKLFHQTKELLCPSK